MTHHNAIHNKIELSLCIKTKIIHKQIYIVNRIINYHGLPVITVRVVGVLDLLELENTRNKKNDMISKSYFCSGNNGWYNRPTRGFFRCVEFRSYSFIPWWYESHSSTLLLWFQMARPTSFVLATKVFQSLVCQWLSRIAPTFPFYFSPTFTNIVDDNLVKPLVTPPSVCQVSKVGIWSSSTQQKNLHQRLLYFWQKHMHASEKNLFMIDKH